MEYVDMAVQFAEKLQILIAALVLMIGGAAKAFFDIRKAYREEAKEFQKKKEQGYRELVPWVVKEAHKTFAMYKAWHGYSDTQKKEKIKDLIVSANRRHNGESSISNDDLEKVVHWASAYWKENKSKFQDELADQNPVVTAVLDAISSAREAGDSAGPGVTRALLSAAALGAGGEAGDPEEEGGPGNGSGA